NIKLKDIKWHDGTILTSNDVKFTIDLINQNIDSPYSELVDNISSISIINDKEFSISFKEKYAFSIDTLIFPIVSEKHLDSNNINNYKNNLIGNGAYKIKTYEERKNLSLIINDSYYDELPSTAKNINVEIVPDEEAQVSMVISLDSDIAKISLDDLSKFYEKEFKTTTYEGRDYECLLFNYNNEIFKDINFRKAVISSINKNQIDRKSTRLNSSHVSSSYAVCCLKQKPRSEHAMSGSPNDGERETSVCSAMHAPASS